MHFSHFHAKNFPTALFAPQNLGKVSGPSLHFYKVSWLFLVAIGFIYMAQYLQQASLSRCTRSMDDRIIQSLLIQIITDLPRCSIQVPNLLSHSHWLVMALYLDVSGWLKCMLQDYEENLEIKDGPSVSTLIIAIILLGSSI